MKANGSGGISESDARELVQSYCEAGVENLHSAREAAREIVDERLEQIYDEAEAVSDRGEIPNGTEGVRAAR